MADGVEEDAHAGLGLDLRERGACGERVLDGRFEILDLDVEVRHHLLPTALGGPHRTHVALLELEGQARRRAGAR